MSVRERAVLVLEDGTSFAGRAVGALGEAGGEVVFTTAMTGYQEVLTDPSFRGHLVVMTYPLVGNYGANEEDVESATPHVRALIVREICDEPSNWRAREESRELPEEAPHRRGSRASTPGLSPVTSGSEGRPGAFSRPAMWTKQRS